MNTGTIISSEQINRETKIQKEHIAPRVTIKEYVEVVARFSAVTITFIWKSALTVFGHGIFMRISSNKIERLDCAFCQFDGKRWKKINLVWAREEMEHFRFADFCTHRDSVDNHGCIGCRNNSNWHPIHFVCNRCVKPLFYRKILNLQRYKRSPMNKKQQQLQNKNKTNKLTTTTTNKTIYNLNPTPTEVECQKVYWTHNVRWWRIQIQRNNTRIFWPRNDDLKVTSREIPFTAVTLANQIFALFLDRIGIAQNGTHNAPAVVNRRNARVRKGSGIAPFD
jgi:hypothetical protein